MQPQQKFIPTIGSDPEAFVQDAKGNIVPVIGLLGGTKWEPKQVADGYFIQEDNVAAEFNIPACKTSEEFVQAIKQGTNFTQVALPRGHSLAFKASHTFEQHQLNHPQALTSGCDPDFDAWTLTPRDALSFENLPDPRTRFCGGHVHIAYNKERYHGPMDAINIVRALDVLLGLPFAWLDPDKVRMKLFGTFGIFRPKPYGIEYRTLSNFWLTDPVYIKFVADVALAAATEPRTVQHCASRRLDDVTYSLNHKKINWWIERVSYAGLSVPKKIKDALADLKNKRDSQ